MFCPNDTTMLKPHHGIPTCRKCGYRASGPSPLFRVGEGRLWHPRGASRSSARDVDPTADLRLPACGLLCACSVCRAGLAQA